MELRDKIAGALYGMALGDAMGMPAELWGRERARKFFGGKITEFIDGPKENDVAFNYNKAQFTDDTGQAMVLLDSLKETDYRPDASDIAKRMLGMITEPFSPLAGNPISVMSSPKVPFFRRLKLPKSPR